MPTLESLASDLAAHLLSGAWTREDLSARVESFLGGRAKRAKRLLVEHLLTHAPDYAPSHARLSGLLLRLDHLRAASAALRRTAGPRRPPLAPPAFEPTARFAGLEVPQLATVGDLAAWLELTARQLDWLADMRGRHGAEANPVLQNYTYTFRPKRSGGYRIIEAPKTRLKLIQRRILRDILDHIPPHPAAHGFVRGRSCLLAAQRHVGEYVVVGMDIADFFPSTPAMRVRSLLRRVGYPHGVARALTALCTTMTPENAFARAAEPKAFDWEARKRMGAPHLPQGAPTSPALANLVAATLDARLDGLARRAGAAYTRYADDLSFSGGDEFQAALRWFMPAAETIVKDEGWRLNPAKTRVMRQYAAQVVTGVVVNRHLNVRREEFDALKAALFNCLRSGGHSQNHAGVADFRAHLAGRIGWVAATNPQRGAKLRAMFERIDWSAPA